MVCPAGIGGLQHKAFGQIKGQDRLGVVAGGDQIRRLDQRTAQRQIIAHRDLVRHQRHQRVGVVQKRPAHLFGQQGRGCEIRQSAVTARERIGDGLGITGKSELVNPPLPFAPIAQRGKQRPRHQPAKSYLGNQRGGGRGHGASGSCNCLSDTLKHRDRATRTEPSCHSAPS